MILYQLKAKGQMSAFDRNHAICSITVFKTREKAEAYKETFKSKCCGSGFLDLLPEETEISIVELHLED